MKKKPRYEVKKIRVPVRGGYGTIYDYYIHDNKWNSHYSGAIPSEQDCIELAKKLNVEDERKKNLLVDDSKPNRYNTRPYKTYDTHTDEMYKKVKEAMKNYNKITIGILITKFPINFNAASDIIDRLVKDGIIEQVRPTSKTYLVTPEKPPIPEAAKKAIKAIVGQTSDELEDDDEEENEQEHKKVEKKSGTEKPKSTTVVIK